MPKKKLPKSKSKPTTKKLTKKNDSFWIKEYYVDEQKSFDKKHKNFNALITLFIISVLAFTLVYFSERLI